MRLRDDALDPDVERELGAIDAALSGEVVDPDLADLAALAGTLAEMRDTPADEFAAGLDARAADGFGRRRRGVAGRLRAMPLRRQVLPVAATALAAIVVATAVIGFQNGGDDTDTTGLSPALTEVKGSAPGAAGAAEKAPPPGSATATAPLADRAAAGKARVGPFASGERRRFVERDAELVLGTDADRLRAVTDDVFAVVGRHDGIVLSSQIEDGPDGEAGAEFRLLVPSPRLGDALADLSDIAEVRSREESSQDITAPVVTVRERIADTRAEIAGLLKQLAAADSDAERDAVTAQLRFQRQRLAGLRFTQDRLERRANLSTVSLEVVTGDAASFGTAGGEWGLTDAVDDAGRVLAVAAGVTVVALAVLAPLALLLGLAALGWRGWIRQDRKRALEGGPASRA
jgi:hypothetical protein